MAFVLAHTPGDVSNPDVEFHAEPTRPPARRHPAEDRRRVDRFAVADYGYTKDRRATTCTRRATCARRFRRGWSLPGGVLLEFPPVDRGGSLYLLKNNGALHALAKTTGQRPLAAQARARSPPPRPAFGDGRVYAVALQRHGSGGAGRVAAYARSDGARCWSKRAAEPRRVLAAARRRPRLLRLRGRHRLRAARRRRPCAGPTRPAARSRAALALADGKLYFGDYGGKRPRDPRAQRPARCGGRHAAARASASARASSTRRPRSPSAASTSATPTARLLVRRRQRQARLGDGHRRLRLRLARRRPGPGRRADRLLRLLRRQLLRARRAPRRGALEATRAGGKISGAATVVGDIVYFSTCSRATTRSGSARAPAQGLRLARGALQPGRLRRPRRSTSPATRTSTRCCPSARRRRGARRTRRRCAPCARTTRRRPRSPRHAGQTARERRYAIGRTGTPAAARCALTSATV